MYVQVHFVLNYQLVILISFSPSQSDHIKRLPLYLIVDLLVYNYLISDDDIVSVGPELVEGEDVEPGPLVAGRIQVDPHRILFQQSRKTFVHRQVFVRFQVKQLKQKKRLNLNQY